MAEKQRGNAADTYKLGRDALASVRLNLQHYYWRESLGYSLHPDIRIDKPDIAIADVGTGTGIWLFELADRLPSSAKLVGLDVSADQFPHPYWNPENVQLLVDDASSGLPAEELRGAFDVVHVRLLMLMITNNDPSPYIRYCLALVKPGGYIQWEEFENYSSTVGHASSESPDEYLPKMLLSLATLDSLKWIPDLPRHFLKEGLNVLSLARHVTPDHHLKGFTDMLCIGQVEFANVLKAAGDTKKEAEVRKGLQKGMAEMAKGTYLRLSMQVVVAQKPSEDKQKIFTGFVDNLERHT